MGISTFILFKSGESAKINDLLASINKICETENLFVGSSLRENDESGILKYCEICISDIPLEENYSRQISFGITDEPYDFRLISFEWNPMQDVYFKSMVSGDFCDNEDLLLKFLYSFLKIYPMTKIWIEEDWVYTLYDLEKITSRTYDNEWCYKNPIDL